ncbi:MAG: CDP-diacylglycerol--glycerol-3-phosphate 3-phosphatidyltransferase [Alphaproteobacteria bacterium]|nr:CDP-diacylglycerol--glycerol-3-phosphate 3-phosphatidyltransferase [Alphaproteobacteria bacterium]
MKFFVNFLSGFRIAAAFAIIPTLLLAMHNPDLSATMYWVTFVLFALGSVSDWFDGYLARKYNACSKLGGVMDHIGDKLLVVNTMIMLAIMLPMWYTVVPIIIMIARELYISGLREFLGTQKIEMPVPKARFSMGKIKTTLQMVSICAFLLIPTLGTLINPAAINPTLIRILFMLSYISVATLWLALVASVWSATQYTMTFVGHLKKIK